MARDSMVPNWLSKIHEKLLTPYRAITLTGVLALLFLLLDSLEDLAKVASVLQLYSYAALNIGCIMLRASNPAWYKPTYRSPGTPWLQLIAAVGCITIIIYSGTFAHIAVTVLIIGSLAWYVVWGRSKVDIEHAIPDFKERWTTHGMKVFGLPTVIYEAETAEEWMPGVRELNIEQPRHVVAALANPETEGDLLKLGQLIAAGESEGGKVTGLSIIKAPYQTPLSTIQSRLDKTATVREIIKKVSEKYKISDTEAAKDRTDVLAKTNFDAVSEAAYNIFNGLIDETEKREGDMILMGWQGGFSIGRIYNSPVQKIIKNIKADVGILKDRGLDEINSILIPWGGGYHAQLGLEMGVRISRAVDAELKVLRLVKPGTNQDTERSELEKFLYPLIGSFENLTIEIRESEDVTGGINDSFERDKPDLVIIGASHEWGIRNVLFGTITDIVADSAPCSVLMVRRYLTEDWKLKASEGIKRMKEQLGLSSSPDSGNEK